MTRLHLVGGFLGSGKTTAIATAAKQLLSQGLVVGVVTNDQGKYLVDTAFFALQDVPAVEVSGGCFCCGYDDFAARLADLRASARPDVIFAESVGSCADLVATVVKPLLDLRQIDMAPSSFSVFADARLLLRHLSGDPLPFGDNVVYLFEQQLAEAGLLVANKIDLLSHEQEQTLQQHLESAFPHKLLRLQNSLDSESVAGWLRSIETDGLALSTSSLDIDYERYGDGEMRLAWLDQVIEIRVATAPVRPAVVQTIDRIMAAIRAETEGIGHVKFIVGMPAAETKLSFTSADQDQDWALGLPPLTGNRARLLMNARVELPAAQLDQRVSEALAALPFEVSVAESAAFHPKQPTPQLRLV